MKTNIENASVLYVMCKKGLKYLHYKPQTIAFYDQNLWEEKKNEKEKQVKC